MARREISEQDDLPELQPDVLPSEATYKGIIGFLMSQIGHKTVRITAPTLREWRLRGVKIIMQQNGSAVLSGGT